MTFVMESIAALAGTATASSAAAATTAGASAWGALQGGLTIASAVSSLIGGYAGMRQSEATSKFQTLEAERAELEAQERSLRIRRETAEKIGATRVAFAGSGLDISGGGAIESGLEAQSSYAQDMLRLNAQYAKAGGMAAAANTRAQGTAGMIAAAGGSFGKLADYYVSVERRGLPDKSRTSQVKYYNGR